MRRPRVSVVAEFALWLFLATALAVDSDTTTAWPLGDAVTITLVLVSILVRRKKPLVSLVLASSLSILYVFGGVGVTPAVVMVVLSYLAGRRMADVRPALFGFAAIGTLGLLLAPFYGSNTTWLTMILVELSASVLPWGIGRYSLQSAELLRAGWERAEQLEREKHIIAEQSRLRERARIARDMHDSLGHELSLIALRAGSLEVATDLNETHRRTAASLRADASAATRRLHDIIKVWDNEHDSMPSIPLGRSVDELVKRAKDSGLDVELHQEEAAHVLSPETEEIVYRLIQESLTNAIKHAPQMPVSVWIAHNDDDVCITVTNELAPDFTAVHLGSGGVGLIGLRERLGRAGGNLKASAHDGRFTVRAELPHGSPHFSDSPVGLARGPEPARVASGHELRHAKLRGRRKLVLAIALPTAVVIVIVGTLFGLRLYTTLSTGLNGDEFDRLQLGQTRAEMTELLPSASMDEALPVLEEPNKPEGAVCDYYLTTTNPFSLSNNMYRLCFVDDVLVAKDRLNDRD